MAGNSEWKNVDEKKTNEGKFQQIRKCNKPKDKKIENVKHLNFTIKLTVGTICCEK